MTCPAEKMRRNANYADQLDAHIGENGKYDHGNVRDLIQFALEGRKFADTIERYETALAEISKQLHSDTCKGNFFSGLPCDCHVDIARAALSTQATSDDGGSHD